MKEKIAWTGWIILFVVLIALISQLFLFNKRSGKNDVWEYTTLVRVSLDDPSSKKGKDELNNLGQAGWELITQEISDAPGIHTLIFKRKK